MNNKKLFEKIYNKYDGRYGDLVEAYLQLYKEYINLRELLGEYKNNDLKKDLKLIELSFK